MVRDALLASVTCTRPPVNFQSSQVSTVPNARRPASANWRALGTCSRIQEILLAEIFVALRLELTAESGGAAILPDNGVVDRFAGCAVPNDSGLALVSDADRGDVAGLCIRFGQCFQG